MRIRSLPLIVLAITWPFLAAFSFKGCTGLNRNVDEINKRVDALTKVVDSNLQAMTRAVPGERMMQLIDAVTIPCDAVPAAEKPKCEDDRRRALAQLQTLSGYTSAQRAVGDYEVSVQVIAADGKPLDVQFDLVQLATGTPAEAKLYLEERAYNPHNLDVADMLPGETRRMLSAPEVEAAIQAAAVGWYNLKPPPFNENCPGFRNIDRCAEAWAKYRKALRDGLVTMITAPYTPIPVVFQSTRASEPWVLASPNQQLVIFFRKSDIPVLKERKASVTAVVHKRGDFASAATRRYTFPLQAFDDSPLLEDPQSHVKLSMASHKMTESYDASPELYRSLVEQRRAIEQILKATTPPSPTAARPVREST